LTTLWVDPLLHIYLDRNRRSGGLAVADFCCHLWLDDPEFREGASLAQFRRQAAPAGLRITTSLWSSSAGGHGNAGQSRKSTTRSDS